MPHPVLLIETLTPWNTRSFVASFFALLFCAVGVGVYGPDRSDVTSVASFTHICDSVASCDISLSAHIGDLRPLQQYLSVSVLLARPLNASLFPFAGGLPVASEVDYYVDLSTDGVNVEANTSHTAPVSWNGPGGAARISVLRISPLTVRTVDVTVRLTSPFSAFVNATPGAAAMSANVSAFLLMRSVEESYSVFEVAWRLCLVAVSATVCIAYGAALRRHKAGTAVAAGLAVPTSLSPPGDVAQPWVWWLSALLVPFNNPVFALQIIYPTVGAAAWAALSTVSFIAALLLFWLVSFHLAALPRSPGSGRAAAVGTLGPLFWAPKVVLTVLIWVTALTRYLWWRVLALADPASRVDEALGELTEYIRIFSYTVLALYLAYLAVLIILATLSCRRGLGRVDGFFVVLTLATIGTIAAGAFTNGFVPVVDRSGAYLAAYACANLWADYVIWLAVAYWPVSRGFGAAESEGGAGTRPAPAGRPVDTSSYGDVSLSGGGRGEGDGKALRPAGGAFERADSDDDSVGAP